MRPADAPRDEEPRPRDEEPRYRDEEPPRRRILRDEEDAADEDYRRSERRERRERPEYHERPERREPPRSSGGSGSPFKRIGWMAALVVIAVVLLLWAYKSCTNESGKETETTENVISDEKGAFAEDSTQVSNEGTEGEEGEEFEIEPEPDPEPVIETEEEDPPVETEPVEEVVEEKVETVQKVEPVKKEKAKTTPNPTPKPTPKPVVKQSTDKTIYDVAEQMPSFPGGSSAMSQFISRNISYPASARQKGVEGHVVVTFVVEPDGSLSGMKVAKSVDPDLDREALHVLMKMPRWQPGKKNGQAVRVRYTLPINFKL